MIKKVLIVTSFIIVNSSCTFSSREIRSINDILIIEKGENLTLRKNITGVYSKELNIDENDSISLYYYQGRLKQLSHVFNGKRQGYHIEFTQEGQLYFTGNYVNKKPDGIFKKYNRNGDLSKLTIYIDGEKISEYVGKELSDLNISADWIKSPNW